jgi:drug/metabolite transporter (DMT)-like permease
MARSDRTAYLLLLGMAVFFGGTWVAGKVAVDEAPPATIAAARFAVATMLLWAWARTRAPVPRPRPADLPLVAALGATAVAGYNLFFLYGLELAPATDGAIIVPGLAPVLTAALAWLLLGERVGRRGALGFALAFVGLVLVVDPAGGVGSDRLLGALLFVLGAACWGVYSILGKTATTRFDPVTATLYGTASGTLMLLPFSFGGGGWHDLAEASFETWASVAYLGVFGTVLAFVLFYEGLKRIGPGRATSFALLVPVFGVLGAVLLLDEPLGVLTLVGGVVVIAGLWLVQHRSGSTSRAHADAAQDSDAGDQAPPHRQGGLGPSTRAALDPR